MTRQTTLFVVTPHSTDCKFKAKMAVLARVAADLGMSPAWALIAAKHKMPSGLRALKNADIVIADLSFERPSCYFEVGFAQAIGKPVALIAKNGTAIHQVIGGELVLFYRTISDYEEVVRQALNSLARIL